jgi:membrane protein DedA with SNARE-associated domain
MMLRTGRLLKMLLIYGIALHLHHKFHGPPIGYAGLALAAIASWVGVPGPGEPVLIAAGVFAARNKLDIASVVLVAWVAATAGGVVGWVVGRKAGRRVLISRGPLQALRRGAVARGDAVFARYTVLAVLFTPSWIAGIHNVRPAVYLPVNALSAALWACGLGLGAYFIGPTVIDFVEDLGLVTGIGLLVLVLAGVGGEVLRRRRARARAIDVP